MEKLSLNSRPSESSANSVAAMSQVLNMPKLEFESFDGSPSQFHRFMSIFKQVIEPATPDATLRLTRLLCHTTGEAHDSISSARIRRVRIAVCDAFLPSCESIFKMVRSMRIIL